MALVNLLRQLTVRLAMPALLLALGLMAVRLLTWPLWADAPATVRLVAIALIIALLTIALLGCAIARNGTRYRNLIAWVGITSTLGAAAILDRDYAVWQDQRLWIDLARGDATLVATSNRTATELRDGQIILPRQIDGHYYIDAEINGVTVNFLVDTGASGVALTLEDARRIGIRIDRLDYSITVSEASNTALAAPLTIRTLSLPGRQFEDIPALVMQGGDRSLLGMSVLERFGSVEIRGDRLVLRS